MTINIFKKDHKEAGINKKIENCENLKKSNSPNYNPYEHKRYEEEYDQHFDEMHGIVLDGRGNRFVPKLYGEKLADRINAVALNGNLLVYDYNRGLYDVIHPAFFFIPPKLSLCRTVLCKTPKLCNAQNLSSTTVCSLAPSIVGSHRRRKGSNSLGISFAVKLPDLT